MILTLKLLLPTAMIRHAIIFPVLLLVAKSLTSSFLLSRSTTLIRSTGSFGSRQEQQSSIRFVNNYPVIVVDNTGTTSLVRFVTSRGRSNDEDDAMDMDDDALRFAYKEWKLIYGKHGEAFDDGYFENFKINYRALMAANLKARKEAEQRGQPTPRWMSLNEFGDYSMEEYEAVQRGEDPRRQMRRSDGGNTYQTVNGIMEERQDQFGRPIRSTQVLQQQEQQRGTQVVRKEGTPQQQQQQQQQQGLKRGTQVISQSNGRSSSEYQDQFGRTIRATQPLQSSGFQTIDEFAKYDNRGTRVIQGDDGTGAINGNAPGAGGGTRVIQQEPGFSSSSSSSPPFDNVGKVVVARSNDEAENRSAGRGTQIIQPSSSAASSSSSDPSTKRSYGTQVISTSSGPNGTASRGAVFGTTAIQSASPPNDNDNQRYGTQVIQTTGYSASPQTPITATSGTLVISKNANVGATTQINRSIRGDNNTSTRGTIIVPKAFGNDDQQYGNDNNDDEEGKAVGGRGTMVIKRQILEPRSSRNLFSILMGSDSKIDENNIPRGTTNMKAERVKVSPTVEKTASPTSNTTSKGLFDFFSSATQKIDSSSRNVGTTKIPERQPPTQRGMNDETSAESERKPGVFSFFGGKPKSDSSSRSVRGTIIIQKDGKNALKAAEDVGRKTVLIPKKESEVGRPPSILSFFGGAKKVTEEEAVRNPSARPTLIIKKPAKPKPLFWSPFPAVDAAPGVSEYPVSPVKKESTQMQVKSKAILQPKMTDFLSKKRKKQNDSEMTKERARINAQIAEQIERREAAARKKIEVAKENELRRKQLQQQREEATRKRQQLAERKKRGDFDSRNKTPIIRLQSTSQPKKPQLPEVRKWKQNSDGSVTGFIYKSKSFRDGTRVTTSPVPRGAKRGTVVTTSAGSKYYLE